MCMARLQSRNVVSIAGEGALRITWGFHALAQAILRHKTHDLAGMLLTRGVLGLIFDHQNQCQQFFVFVSRVFLLVLTSNVFLLTGVSGQIHIRNRGAVQVKPSSFYAQ